MMTTSSDFTVFVLLSLLYLLLNLPPVADGVEVGSFKRKKNQGKNIIIRVLYVH